MVDQEFVVEAVVRVVVFGDPALHTEGILLNMARGLNASLAASRFSVTPRYPIHGQPRAYDPLGDDMGNHDDHPKAWVTPGNPKLRQSPIFDPTLDPDIIRGNS